MTSPITGLGGSIQRQSTTELADPVEQTERAFGHGDIAAVLQRLLDPLAQRKELAHRKEREAPRG